MKYGIPYKGSKRKHARKLIDKMLEMKPNAKYFYDLFGGGGAMSMAALERGLIVFYNEKNKDLTDLLAYCLNPTQKSKYGIFPEHFYDFVSHEDFNRIKKDSGLYSQFVRVCYSFGNGARSYFAAPDKENVKSIAHCVVVKKCDKSLDSLNDLLSTNITMPEEETINERRLSFGRQIKSNLRLDLEQLERLQQLQQLQQLERLPIHFTSVDYRDVIVLTPEDETIIYLDPPYRGTEGYHRSFNHSELDSWFSLFPHLAFMSEYAAPFDCVLEIQTRTTLSASSNSVKVAERLFINKVNDVVT